ncbi:MAG: ABC transporter permease [Planctomycetes bacterium]|nr:ABC transporter permease [Planctomycetota bacterium]
MKKILGIFGLLVIICLVTTAAEPQFVSPFNVENLIRWTALFGIISIGVAFVIITGGIDLSIGSVIGLTGSLLPLLLAVEYAASGDRVTVEEVAPRERTVVVSPADFGLIPGDRLEFRSGGRSRRLTVAGIEPEDGRLVLKVRENPSFLNTGDQPTVSYLNHMSVPLAFGVVMLISAGIGVTHGLLITKLRLQPFVVTLCGLLFYRGLARVVTGDNVQGFGTGFEGLKYLAQGRPFSIPVPFLRWISDGNWSRYQWNWQQGRYAVDAQESLIALPLLEWIAIPMPVVILTVIAVAAGVFLNFTIYGRYLLALGRNEQAARYSGINTDRMVILAYVICSLLAGLAGVLFALDLNSVQPSGHGNFYELYAIAAAVLGGCSLRGGEGSILGVVIGAAVMRVLYNSINLMDIPTQMEFAIIGLVILAGVMVDELVKRYAARRRAKKSAVAEAAAA